MDIATPRAAFFPRCERCVGQAGFRGTYSTLRESLVTVLFRVL